MGLTATDLTTELFQHTRPAFLRPVDEAYLWLFWRPLLAASEAQVFDLWKILLTIQQQITAGQRDGWPGIGHLAQVLATGDRYTITGRAATKTRPAQRGLLVVLAEEGLITYTVTGEGTRAARYSFDVRPGLPMLAPRQVQQLSPWLQEQHDAAVYARLSGPEARIWQGITAGSLMPWAGAGT